jgi:hypothetical protein
VLAVDRRKKKGGDHGNRYTGGKSLAIPPSGGIAKQRTGDSHAGTAAATAEKAGTSARNVGGIRRIKPACPVDPRFIKCVIFRI